MRDRTLPHRYRYLALRRAAGHHMPLGPHATWDYITGRAGDVRHDEGALVHVLDVLEAGRDARHAELAEFARRRSADKRERHSRTVTVEESRYRHGWRWPGPDAHDATLHTVTAEHRRPPLLRTARFHPCRGTGRRRQPGEPARGLLPVAEHRRFPGPGALRPDESLTCAFPDALDREVRAAVRVLPKARFSPVGSFRVTVGDLDVPGSPAGRAYGRFLADNPRFSTLVQQRVASYWACYHRGEFPRLADYPGHRLITAMRAALTQDSDLRT
ncbi:hypothetical protein AB0J37_27430 [Microbispora rosea]|uniref:hypothetical protein n=1 Tax=Microbispora rosea TaxID=58117 RepID=UPI0034485384